MKQVTNIISMEEVKNKKEWNKRKEETDERMNKKDYILTIKVEGDKLMSKGDVGREVEPTSYYVICSLEEIPEYIESIKNPFWIPESGTSNEDILNYPFEKKRWGRNTNVVIEPLSKELEESYLDGSKKGFFETWRGFREMEEEEKRKVI